jgi:hypothetical protein
MFRSLVRARGRNKTSDPVLDKRSYRKKNILLITSGYYHSIALTNSHPDQCLLLQGIHLHMFPIALQSSS